MSTQPDPSLIDDLVLANHILVNQGVLDGFGHISVRDPANPQRFFIARSMAPALVQADDIVVCDLDSNVIDERGRKTYLERFIHGEIFKLRPDVNSVIHSHSPSVIPFGVTGARLRPICHMSGFLGATTPVYEIRHTAGEDSDLLVRSHALGKALAEVLGERAMRTTASVESRSANLTMAPVTPYGVSIRSMPSGPVSLASVSICVVKTARSSFSGASSALTALSRPLAVVARDLDKVAAAA